MKTLVDELVAAVGTEHVIVDPEVLIGYRTDWTGNVGGPVLAVARPADTAQAAAVLSTCVRHGVAVVPQGGNTGLVQGGIPPTRTDRPTLILSTRRLSRMEPVDAISGQITVGAGVTLAQVQRAARAAGWEYGVDLAARDSATIGGTVATNAGGVHVIAYGMTRSQVIGIEAVLARTEPTIVEHLGGLAKDNTGYDLAASLTGSEGTLALITAVRLQLHRPMGRTTVALIGAESYLDALDLLNSAVRPGVRLRAAEVMDAFGVGITAELIGDRMPLADAHELLVLVEIADGGDASGFRVEALDGRDVVVAVEASEQSRLWELRERHTEAYNSFCAREGIAALHKLDVSVPLARLSEWAHELGIRVSGRPGVAAFGLFGHLGDGNLHVQVCSSLVDDESVDEVILRTVSEFGGSVSAEHGIGRLKARWLGLSRSPQEIDLMRQMKSAWDPAGVLNPGVIVATNARA